MSERKTRTLEDCERELREAQERPKIWLQWARQTFGDIALDPRERTLRFVEEAVELAHAMGLEEAVVSAIAERVYGRERGTISREIGQAMACLECLAESIEVNANDEATRELARVQTIPQEEWDRRHAAKMKLGIALAEPRPTPTPTTSGEPHPWYGPCDALRPDGGCAECANASPPAPSGEPLERVLSGKEADEYAEAEYWRGWDAGREDLLSASPPAPADLVERAENALGPYANEGGAVPLWQSVAAALAAERAEASRRAATLLRDLAAESTTTAAHILRAGAERIEARALSGQPQPDTTERGKMADLEALKREKEIALTCYQQIRYAKVKTEEDVKVALQRYLSACDAYNDAIEKLF